MARELEAYTTDKKNDFPKRERRAHRFLIMGRDLKERQVITEEENHGSASVWLSLILST